MTLILTPKLPIHEASGRSLGLAVYRKPHPPPPEHFWESAGGSRHLKCAPEEVTTVPWAPRLPLVWRDPCHFGQQLGCQDVQHNVTISYEVHTGSSGGNCGEAEEFLEAASSAFPQKKDAGAGEPLGTSSSNILFPSALSVLCGTEVSGRRCHHHEVHHARSTP